MTEKNRWPGQREILKNAAYVSIFLIDCEVMYNQILEWNNELQTLTEKSLPHHIHNIAHLHKSNMASVEEAIKDAMKRTNKITESIVSMELVTYNNEPAIEAVLRMGRKLQELEDNVMRVAVRISEHFQVTN